MSLEISEIGIRLALRDPSGDPPDQTRDRASAVGAAEIEAIVSRCVREVLRLLARAEAR